MTHPSSDRAATPSGSAHQADPQQRARLRWRSRRGLLENDIVFERFFEQHEMTLSDEDVAALGRLLDLSDNELLDLILVRHEPEGDMADAAGLRVLGWLRTA